MGEFGVERRVVLLLGLVGALLDGRRVPAGVEMGVDGTTAAEVAVGMGPG